MSARSAFLHEGAAKRLATSFKYDGLKVLGRVMAELAADEFRGMLASLGPVVVTWVPSHASDERARGYNQAEILAHELARVAGGLPVMPLARKVDRTVHQRGLDREGRSRNLRGAFRGEKPPGPWHSTAVFPGHSTAAVLVDDVYTTGATVAEVSRVIVSSWGSPVHVFTFGRTPADLPQRAD
ncbi:MAG: ComF family protein [Thermoleophilia bacterium]